MLPVVIGTLALVGWLLDADHLKRGIASGVAMNPATATGFILLGFEALRLYAGNNDLLPGRIGQLAVWVVVITSATKLGDLMFHTSFGIDQLLFAAQLDQESGHPNRMAPNTAVCFFLLGWAMLSMRSQTEASIQTAQALTVIPALFTLLAIVGYIYGTESFYGIGSYIPMALNTAIAFLILSVTILFAHPHQGYMRVLTGGGAAGKAATILLPATLIVPFLVGWVTLAALNAKLFDPALDHAISVAANVGIFFALSYLSIRSLFLSDLDRLKAEAIREDESKYRLLFEASSDGIFLQDATGKFIDCNETASSLCGLSRMEIVGRSPADISPERQPDGRLSREVADEKLSAALSGIPQHFEYQSLRSDGMLFDVELTLSRIEYRGAPCLQVIARDITERKKADEELRVAAVAFETHDAIVITDSKANIVRVNQAFTDITGFSSEEVLGQNPRIMSSGRQDKTFYTEMWQQLLHTGSWAGEIWDKRKNGQVYPKWLTITAVKNKRQQTTHYVAIFSDISARKQTEDEIRNLAFYDALTQLPNRRLFMDRFRAALAISSRRNDYGAVLFIDLDRFKAINDTLGHDYGDMLLIEVATRIKSCVREMDSVARLGGDEFVVLIEGVSEDREEASRNVGLIAEKIRETLAHPYKLRTHEHHSSPSIGISLYRGNENPVDDLLQQADMAMYQAKDSGRNAVRFFNPAMQRNAATCDVSG